MKLKGLIAKAAMPLLMGVGVFAGVRASRSEAKVEKAEAATSSQDVPFVVRCWDDLGGGFYNTSGWSVGLYCTGGSGFTARTIKMEPVNDYVGVGILPAGTTKFKVIRTSNTLPMNGEASGDKWGEWDYNSSYNVVTLQKWPSNGGAQAYNESATALPKGKAVFADVSAVSSSWYSDNAKTFLYTFLNNSSYHMSAGSEHREMTRVANSNYFYYVPSSPLVLDGVIVNRGNDTSKFWNQTTDIKYEWGFNPLYTTAVESGKDGSGHYNWNHNANKNDTAQIFGRYFLNNVTCDGKGNIKGETNWSNTSAMYSRLCESVQGEVWLSSGSDSGTDLQKAVYRYDYIVFYKKYSGYTDYIGRSDSSGNPYASMAPLSPKNIIREGSASTGIAIIASAGAIAAAGGFFFLKKKKSLM